jgi:transposase
MVKRSTLSEANARRSHQFFAKVYSHLYQKYHKFLPDSRKHRSWDHLLHIMDSTTISLFSNVLKGVGRHPKSGKKKGGIKVHTLLKAQEGLPYDVHFTSAATHDHVMLHKLKLTNGSFLAMDRAYIDYKVFEQLTQQGVFYVTKMKKNQRYQEQQGCYYVNSEGRIVLNDSEVIFTKEALTHQSRKVSYWESGKAQPVVLLTNNFELPAEEIIEIYHRRWQIELLFKQLKQNFPLKYFYGESENAIKIQIWVALIANLLLSVVKRKIQRKWSFSNLVTMIRQALMSYINLYSFCEQPEKAWLALIKARQKSPPIPTLFD